jgi:serine phosphatase RsbU (regulator of sigma subunit)
VDIDKTVIADRKSVAGGSDKTHYLLVTAGPSVGHRFEIPPQTSILGRGEDARIRIKDRGVSKQHCRLVHIADAVVLEDLNSTNGTFVDGEKVTQARALPVGSVLQIGNTFMLYEVRSRQEVEMAERQDADLKKAVTYVRSLLPQPLKQGPVLIEWTYIPSEKLGGDAFGYHWVSDNLLGIYLLDVCGHGTASALHGTSVINVMRKQTLPGADFRDPAPVFKALNDSFQMEEHSGLYFTMWYSLYDTQTRKLRFGSAGHPPALLLTHGGTESQRLKTPNLPIGMVPGAPFRSAEMEIPPGSRLYLYSDGAFEIVTREGEEWSLEEFLNLISAAPAGPADGETMQIAPGSDSAAVANATGGAAFEDETTRIENGVRETMRAETFDDDFSLVVVEFP